MKKRLTILTAVALLVSLNTESQAGVSGNEYTAAVTEDGVPVTELCMELTPRLNLVVFAFGDAQVVEQSTLFEGTYWELDFFGVFGIFRVNTVAGIDILLTMQGSHLLGRSIFGTGRIENDFAGADFDFRGTLGCDDE